MEAQLTNKDERVEIRISAYDKRIFQKAQKLSGDKSFSSFIVRIVKEQSEEIVAKKDRIISSERDRKIFFDAVYGVHSKYHVRCIRAKPLRRRTSPLHRIKNAIVSNSSLFL